MIGMNVQLRTRPGAARQMRAAQAQAGGVAILPYQQRIQQEGCILPTRKCPSFPAKTSAMMMLVNAQTRP